MADDKSKGNAPGKDEPPTEPAKSKPPDVPLNDRVREGISDKPTPGTQSQ